LPCVDPKLHGKDFIAVRLREAHGKEPCTALAFFPVLTGTHKVGYS
jgi:hypothetical protein